MEDNLSRRAGRRYQPFFNREHKSEVVIQNPMFSRRPIICLHLKVQKLWLVAGSFQRNGPKNQGIDLEISCYLTKLF